MNETPPTAGESFVICVFIQDTHTTAHKENELRKLEYTVRQKDVPCTVGKLMKRQFALTDRQISRLKFMDQGIVLNDRQARTSVKVQAGDRLEIRLEDGHRGESAKNQRKPETGENSRIRYPEETEAQKKRAVQKLRILYEDQDLLIVDKPAGMAVHRGRGHYGDTLADLAEEYLTREKEEYSEGKTEEVSKQGNGPLRRKVALHERAGRAVAHTAGRLDRDTSGIVIFAKSAVCASKLQKLREEGKLRKIYLAAACGFVGEPGAEFTIDTPLMRDPHELNKMMAAGEADSIAGMRQEPERMSGMRCSREPEGMSGMGRSREPEGMPGMRCSQAAGILPAVTHVRVLESNEEFSTLQIWLETGRTHQIRVHMMSAGHPLLGDPVYGGAGKTANAQEQYGESAEDMGERHRTALHCRSVEFMQPFTGEKVFVKAPLPDDLKELFHGEN